MHHPKLHRKVISLAVAGACMSAAAAYAQDAANNSPADTSVPTSAVQTVVVSGLRASLATSLNLKRQSDGIVDGIVAEDIGKFPDTNLAESLQRISGVSISRSNGEGAQVTVRGIDPGLNMVLLNGRQIPNAGGSGAGFSRAFDFGNLAADAISQLQVYKTSRADTPTGGIGATINVMTARPFDRKGFYGTVGVKGVYDTSNNNLPELDKTGKAFTPEFSGLISSTTEDGRWGFGASASFQKRNSGRAVAQVGSEWQGPWTTGAKDAPPIAGTPAGRYIIPQNLGYVFTGTNRERTNAQLVVQFAPVKDVTTTLDYTYAKNKVHTLANDVSAWFQRGNGSNGTFTNNGGNAINSPLTYTETVTNADYAMGANDNSSAAELKSVGFNAQWRVNNGLKLEFDAHHSVAENKTTDFDGGLVATASFSRGTTTVDFRNEFPVLSVAGVDFARAPQETQGTILSPFYTRNVVDQASVKGSLQVFEASSLKFGLTTTKQSNRNATALAQANAWGAGAGGIPASQYPTSLWHDETVGKYFDKLGGSGNPALIQNFRTFREKELLAYMRANAPDKSPYIAPTDWNQTDRRTTERSKSLYAQVNTDWDTAMPMHTAVGVRYEKTDVSSAAQVASGQAIVWGSENELPITYGPTVFTNLGGSYKYVLPSVDWDMDVTSDFKVRASYGETIGRPTYDKIQGGQTLDSIVRADFGTGTSGNPALRPVKSRNIDLSAEWYFAKSSFVAVNAFWKNLKDFAASGTILGNPSNLHTPIGGALYNEAVGAGGCASASNLPNCVRSYIFRTHPTAPGVDVAKGTITGQASDPLAVFKLSTYTNADANKLNGLEFNLQHMFGNSGFGVTANYTYVHSGLKYDNESTGTQTPLIGLSNSANLVGIFENDRITTRLAYNWRGEFLNGFGSNGPAYTEPFGQLDLSVGYNVAKNISVTFEAFNFTNQTNRVHNRNGYALRSVEQNGPRYTIGARYKF
jgi:TonB-dependent receptor